jgi:ribonucleotide reductase alpha subunit
VEAGRFGGAEQRPLGVLLDAFHEEVSAQKLWYAILEAQVETGNPFMLYKDAANGTYPSRMAYHSFCAEIVRLARPSFSYFSKSALNSSP